MADVSKIQLPNGSEYDIRDASKQPLLVSGTNIKTVNSSSLLGEGNLSVGTVTSIQAGNGLSISGTSTTNPTVNIGSNYKLPTTNEWNAKAPLASPALTGTPTAPTANAGTNTTQIATTAFVKTAIDNLPEPMLFKGSVGTDGTVTWANFPSAAAGNEGWTYKVITAHSADTKCPACKVGDTIISNGSAWTVIPSGDEPSGTVTSVGLSAPTGFSVSGSPVTSSGTLALSFASGYSLPTTAKQTNWDTAYSHATSKGSAFSSGLYKITTNSEGHVTAATAVAKSDITALGIPGSDTNTTYTLSSGAGTADDTKIILTPSSGNAQKITVPYASSAGTATSAGSAPWTGITDRPTKLSQFTNDVVNNSTITIKQTGISDQTFTLNGSAKTITLADTNTWRPLGTGANDACAGNDSRLSNARPASDVYAWAKEASKPSYHAGELAGVPTSYKVTSVSAGLAPYISDIGNNIFAGATTTEIKVERSLDNGSTWTDVTTSEAANVKNVFSGCVTSGLLVVSSRDKAQVGDRLRITFNPYGSSRYCTLGFIYVYFSTEGCVCICDVEKNKYTEQNTWTAHTTNCPIYGWPGPNIIGMGGTIFGQGDSRNNGYGIRMTFRITSVSSSYNSKGYIYSIQGFASNKPWGDPGNSLALFGTPYRFTNADRAVAFDNTVTATKFIGALQGNADTATSATSATNATNLVNNPSLAASGNNITVTAGGKTSSAFTVPYASTAGTASSATSATSATTATTATNLANKPSLAASGNAINVTAGGKTSDNFTVPYATAAGSASTATSATSATTATTATNLANNPSIQAGTTSTSKVTITAGGKTSDEFTIPYATSAGSASSVAWANVTGKPTIPTVNNATLTIQKNGTAVKTFTANASTDVTCNITVPTKTSELTNDSGYITGYTDNKTLQTVTTSSNTSWRPLIIGDSYSDAATFAPSTTTAGTYATHLAKFAPSTGVLAVVGLNKMNTNGTTATGSNSAVFNTNGGTTTLATVATSGSYNDLSNKPTIPSAANNGAFNVKTLVGSTTTTVSGSTANQSGETNLIFVQGSNVTLTPDATNKKITIAATDTTYSSKSAASGGTDVSLCTTGEKYTWNNKGTYSKPSGGIPKTDLASAVQTSLGKADTALQTHQSAFAAVSVYDTYINASQPGDSIAILSGNNVTITPDAANKRITISATDTNTHRPVQVNGTEILGNTTEPLNIAGGNGITVSGDASGVMVSADVYQSKSAASGGTALSLVTTGEKYTWNSKMSSGDIIRSTKVTYLTISTFAATISSSEQATVIIGNQPATGQARSITLPGQPGDGRCFRFYHIQGNPTFYAEQVTTAYGPGRATFKHFRSDVQVVSDQESFSVNDTGLVVEFVFCASMGNFGTWLVHHSMIY